MSHRRDRRRQKFEKPSKTVSGLANAQTICAVGPWITNDFRAVREPVKGLIENKAGASRSDVENVRKRFFASERAVSRRKPC